MKKLIFTVDDIGFDKALDVRFMASVRPSAIQRASVVIGFGDLAYMREWLSHLPSVDIHLNATEFGSRNNLGEKEIQRAAFVRRAWFCARIAAGQLSPQKVFAVWDEQIKSFMKVFGRVPDGINSHEHVHLVPPYFKIALRLAEMYRIPYVRLGMRPLFLYRDVRTWLFCAAHAANARNLQKTSVGSSSALYSYDSGAYKDIELEMRLPEGCEVIFHPYRPPDVSFLRGFEPRLKA